MLKCHWIWYTILWMPTHFRYWYHVCVPTVSVGDSCPIQWKFCGICQFRIGLACVTGVWHGRELGYHSDFHDFFSKNWSPFIEGAMANSICACVWFYLIVSKLVMETCFFFIFQYNFLSFLSTVVTQVLLSPCVLWQIMILTMKNYGYNVQNTQNKIRPRVFTKKFSDTIWTIFLSSFYNFSQPLIVTTTYHC